MTITRTSVPLSSCPSPTNAAAMAGATMSSNLRKPTFVERLWRSAAHAALAELTDAELTVRDADGSRNFGRRGSPQDPAARITIVDPSFYRACALRGVVGAGEAYMDGAWHADDLTAVIRAMARNTGATDRMNRGTARIAVPLLKAFAFLHRNTRSGSRENIAAHYDLGNEMFEQFLDPSMTYSSGVFEDAAASLEDAQIAKYDRLCRKLDLRPEDHVLEIGTGWGGFALHAALNYGCRVTTTTISAEQHALACERVAQAGLNDRITIELSDYRDLTGSYDKVVSIEMIEAVGHEYMENYFRALSDRLKPDGICALQAITNPDQAFEESKQSVEFIRRYIFPGGHLPSIWSMSDAVKKATDFRMVHLEEMSPHYARTLELWRSRFHANSARIRALGYPERFMRMWEFYLCYCEGAFLERSVGVVQVVFEKPRTRRDWIRTPHGFSTAREAHEVRRWGTGS